MKKKLAGAATIAILTTSFSGAVSAATYEVKSGDSLWKIASQFNTSVSRVKELNNLRNDIIYPKQILKIDDSVSTVAPQPATQSRPAASTSATTYTVQPGDYLIKIASKHNITLAQLKEWNGLTTDLIRIGQVLVVSKGSAPAPAAPSVPAPTPAPVTTENTAGTTYKVVAGDTLSRIAVKYGTTVAKLKELNGLSSDLIRVGQVLKVNGQAVSDNKETVTQPSAPPVQQAGATVVDIAKKLTGVKYVWGGSTPAGFDCSGFIYYAFNQSGKKISRLSSEGYFDRSYYVNNPEPGDLVFFQNTYKSGISHMGIYVGNGQFIHAGSNGVEIASVSNSYWKSKFNGYKKFY